jgi:hypothetical protein
MPTKTDELSAQQLAAVDMLSTGASITATAEAVGVTRQTVSEWANRDPQFRAALNRRRAEVWAEQKDRVRALLPKAVERIERAFQADDGDSLRAALALLKLAGLGELHETGPTDPETVTQEDFLVSIAGKKF